MAFKRHSHLWLFASLILLSGATPLKENYLAVPHTVSAPHCPLCTKYHCYFFEKTKISPATGDSWTLPSNEAIGFKQQQAVNQIRFSEEAQCEGVPEWKERKQESRKGLLKRCILSNLAVRKLNLLNKQNRVFLTYIDVPEFLLQVSVGNGEEKEIELGKNYQIPQKNIRLLIHRILAANNC